MHRDVAGHQHVFGLAGLAEGEHRIVFDQPQFVGGGLVARIGEALHRAPDRFVGLAAEVADAAARAARTRRSDRPLHFRMLAQHGVGDLVLLARFGAEAQLDRDELAAAGFARS